jgi:hypothetical protein
MKKIYLSDDVNHLEDGIINDHIPVNTGAMNTEDEIEFVDPVKIQRAEDYMNRKKTMINKAAHIIRTSGKNSGRKYLCMMYLKKSFPDISLKEFCNMYVKSQNQDTIEDVVNNQIADSVEQDFLFGKGRQRRALRRKGVSRKQARKTVRQKKIIRKKVSGAVKKVGAAAKRTAIATALLPLRPFKNLMIKRLNAIGKPYSKKSKMVDIVTGFYKYVVKGNHFEQLPDDWYEKDLMYYEPMEFFSEDYIEPATITVIVTAVISFIKKARDKKNKGLPATDAEKAVADEADKFIAKVEQRTGKDFSKPSPIVEAAKGQIISEYKTDAANKTQFLIMVGAAILLLVVLFK